MILLARLALWAALSAFVTAEVNALPKRLVVAVDGVSYRDVKALQQGVTYKDPSGKEIHRQGFNEGYFPVSRNVSTFPSTSFASASCIGGTGGWPSSPPHPPWAWC